jgi:hypothetical protein
VESFDPGSGRPYYVHEQSAQTVWDHPGKQASAAIELEDEAAAEAAAAITGGVSDEYDEMVDPASGAAYFVHRQSGASVWERPSFVGS